MGLPQILIEFRSKGTSAIKRSQRGIVALILRDNTVAEEKLTIYNSLEKIDFSKWSEKNSEYMKLAFLGAPAKLIVLRIEEESSQIAEALACLRDLKWNYLSMPTAKNGDAIEISTWIKGQRDNSHKTFKAVLPNSAANHEGVINLTTDNFTVLNGEDMRTYNCAEYCARIAGLLAGLSLARSCTNYALDEIVKCDSPENPDERIDRGEFIIHFDADNYTIGRGVNSLVTATGTKGADRKKIKIIESMDMYLDDVRGTFKDNYLGMMINDYDNKQALVAAINSYHRALEGDVLDAAFENSAGISLEAQRNFLVTQGQNTEEMTDLQILQANTGSHVFLQAKIKFVDAMEDFDMTVDM